jgi:Zn-dependent protease with chaperone function
MAVYEEKTHPKPRLNPFAFPSDTEFRFVMLIAATISASFLIYNFLYTAFPDNLKTYTTRVIWCSHTTYSGSSLSNLESFLNAYSQCIAPTYLVLAAWVGLGVALLFSVAAAIYWLLPRWKIWRDGLRPLEISNTPPGMMAYLAELCRQAELRRFPVFLLNPYSSAASGVAFGRLGGYYVVLHAGLIQLFQNDRPFFRAVLLHELAHIRNGDINKTYFTISIVWSFSLTAFLPWIVSQFLYQLSFQGVVDKFTLGWPVLLLTAVIYLIRNAILRSRELYADVRASEWDRPDGALGRVLGTLSPRKGRRLRRILRTHPNPDRRQHLLQDTSSLFRLGFWDAFAAGLIVTGVLSNVNWLLILFYNNSLQEIAPGLVGAPLLVGIVGLGMWRAIFARRASGQAPPRFIAVTFGLLSGLLLGQPLTILANIYGFGYFTDLGYTNSISLSTAFSSTREFLLAQLIAPKQFTVSIFFTQLASIAIVSAILLVLLYGLLRWMRACFAAWLEVALLGPSPRRIYWIGFAITSIVLGIALGELSYNAANFQGVLAVPELLQPLQQAFQLPTQNPIIIDTYFIFYNLMSDPLITVAFICLWAYPLATWFWRKRASSIYASKWAFLDKSSQSWLMNPPSQAPFRLRLALILGLAGGAAYCIILYIFFVSLNMDLSIHTDIAPLAGLLQGGITAIVAVSVRRLPVFHCLFTAFVAGCLMCAGLTGVFLFSVQLFTPNAVWNIIQALNNHNAYTLIINESALFALLTGLIVTVLANWLRELWQARQCT